MEMPGKCGNQKGAYLGLETVGLVLDVVITCIPIFITWSMRLLFSQKITVVAIFSANGLQVRIFTSISIKRWLTSVTGLLSLQHFVSHPYAVWTLTTLAMTKAI
jgi:hypothetical protein